MANVVVGFTLQSKTQVVIVTLKEALAKEEAEVFDYVVIQVSYLPWEEVVAQVFTFARAYQVP